MRATVPTVTGEVRVPLERSRGRLDLELHSPPDTTAIVTLPAARDGRWERLFVDEELRWQRAAGDVAAPPALELSPGRHRIRAEH